MRNKSVLIFLLFAVFSTVTILAQDKERAKGLKTAEKRSKESAKIFREMMSKPDSEIPKNLLDKARAIMIFPGALRVAFGIGGQGGRGVISRRTKNGWSEPAFFKLGGGSVGFQIGADKTDYILLVMNDNGLKGLLEDKFEIGGDVTVAAGPLGRSSQATTNVTLDAAILGYSKSKGLFAGIALKGAAIYPDNELNNEVYNKEARTILGNVTGMPITQMPVQVRSVPLELERRSPVKL